jgi:hypothetical protein
MGKGYGAHSSDLSFGKEFSSSPRGILVSFQGAGLEIQIQGLLGDMDRDVHSSRTSSEIGGFFVDGK